MQMESESIEMVLEYIFEGFLVVEFINHSSSRLVVSIMWFLCVNYNSWFDGVKRFRK